MAKHVVKGNQPGQAAFLRDLDAGATFYQGGLGAGKTYAAARKLLYFHALNRCPGLAVAPTYGDLWRFVVPAITEACDELHWEYKVRPNGSGDLKFPHVMVEGQPIILLSADTPERFAGFEVGHIWVDEGPRCQQSRTNPLRDSPTQIRTRLRHKKAKRLTLIVSGTPEGTDTWTQRDFVSEATRLPDHRVYYGSTAKNDALPPGYIETLTAALPADLLKQYLDGEAVDYTADRAHPTFRRETHVVDQAFIRAPVHVGADFNVSPLCWVAAQQVGDRLVVVDELVMEDFGLVDSAVRIAHDRGWHAHGPVILHPDRSGNARNRVGDPEVTVLMQTARALEWDIRGEVFGANPSVNSRINLVSRMLLDGAGVSRLVVADRCARVIDELSTTGRKSSGYDPGSGGKRGHILDALGYAVWDLFAPEQAATVGNWNL